MAREAKQTTRTDEPKRESGPGPVRRDAAVSKPPPPPAPAARFEPMTLGANAFAPPMYVASNEEEPSRWRKAMPFLIVAGIALGSALAVWIVMLVNQPPSPGDAEKEQKEPAAEVPELEPPAAPEAPAAEAQAQAAARPDPGAPAEETKPAAEAEQPAAEASAAKPEAPAGKEEKEDGRSSEERDAARERRHAARAAKGATAAPAANKPAAPSRADIIAAMGKVQPAVVRCMSGTRGIVTADMKILSTGRVASVNVTGAFGPAGSCIAGAVRKAKFPEFTTPSIAVKYPMKL